MGILNDIAEAIGNTISSIGSALGGNGGGTNGNGGGDDSALLGYAAGKVADPNRSVGENTAVNSYDAAVMSAHAGGGNDKTMNNDPADAPTQAAAASPVRRGSTSPDASVLTAAMRRRSGGGSQRGGVLSSVYQLPTDSQRAARTLQSFNGRRAGTVLGQ